MESAVRELHLRLGAHGRRDVPTIDMLGYVGHTRLPDAGFPAQDDHATPPGERVAQELVDCLTFGTTSEEFHGGLPTYETS